MVSNILLLCFGNVFDMLHSHALGMLAGLPALRDIRPDLLLALGDILRTSSRSLRFVSVRVGGSRLFNRSFL